MAAYSAPGWRFRIVRSATASACDRRIGPRKRRVNPGSRCKTLFCSSLTYRISSWPERAARLRAPCAKQAAKHRRGKRIEEKSHARTRRKRELCGIAAVHPHRYTRASDRSPQRHIPAADARQRGMHFNSNYGAEWVGRGQQHGAAHACAQVDKCVRIDRRSRRAAPPAYDDALKYRWRDRVVSRHVPVVAAARIEVAPRHQAAGAHPKFQIEWMPDEPIFYGESRQETRLGFSDSGFAWRANAHV